MSNEWKAAQQDKERKIQSINQEVEMIEMNANKIRNTQESRKSMKIYITIRYLSNHRTSDPRNTCCQGSQNMHPKKQDT